LGLLVDGADEVRRAVRQLVKDGADCIKLEASAHALTRQGGSWLPTMTEAEIRAAVEEAHQYGLRVAAHAEATQGIKNALRGGVDTLEHGAFLDEEALRLLVEKGTWLVPTLADIYSYLDEGPRLGYAPHVIDEMRATEKPWVESFRRAMEAGAKIVVGSDAGNRYRQEDRAIELELLVRHGLSPMKTLLAATREAAEALGMGDRVGTLESGKLADVLLVEGNPLEDMGVLRQRHRLTVFKGGQRVAD
jgi:imidazolonepropionase-like amidohydrolase